MHLTMDSLRDMAKSLFGADVKADAPGVAPVNGLSWREVVENYKQPEALWHRDRDDTDPTLACNRLYGDAPGIEVRPKFRLPENARFFTIGSCFAASVELALEKAGYAVNDALRGSSAFVARENMYGDAALLHRFNAPSMQREIENYIDEDKALSEELIYPLRSAGDDAWHDDDAQFLDAHYASNQPGMTRARIAEMRGFLRDAMRQVLHSADCVIITLGLSEAIYDTEAELFLNRAPPLRYAAKSRRFSGVWVDTERTLAAIEAIRTLVRKSSSRDVRFVVTVSPVGLTRTFTGQDVVVANMLSKSQLRVAAARFAAAHDDVDYFPSYEMVMLAAPQTVWMFDRRHVRHGFVTKVTDLFIEKYLRGAA